MLAPRASSAFVCLRCEAQIAQRRLRALPRRTPHAKFSASARLRDGTAHSETVPQAQQPTFKITKEVQRLNRLKTRKGKLIRETSAPLGLKRLGDEADILVLKEVGDPNADKPDEQPEIEPFEPVPVPDIVASLQQEGKAVTPEEIFEQVESLRPESDAEPGEPHHVKQATFVKLKKLLMSSFTQQQLMAFYSVAKNIRQDKVNKGVLASITREKGDARRAVERSEWQPGTTSITQRLPGLDRYVKIKGYTKNVSKQLLVDRILRDAWRLVLLEEIEAPGELEFFLKPWQIALLNVGENETMLEQIARARRARLDIYKDHDVLRITADKSSAEYAANDIEEALQNTTSKRMNVDTYKALLVEGLVPTGKASVLDMVYSQHDFDVVSTLTRTSIEKVNETMLMIRGFDTPAVEEARRTLIRFLPLTDSTTRTFDIQKLGATKRPSSMLPVFLRKHSYLLPVFLEKSLDHKYREIKLGRISLPVMRLTEPEIADDEVKPVTPTKKPTENPKKSLQGLMNRIVSTVRLPAADLIRPEGAFGHWQPETEYKLSAEIGQVLFPLEHTDPSEAMEAAIQQPSRSPFSPTFPGLASLLASPDLTATARLKTPVLLYGFLPAPDQPNFEAGQMFPSLHIAMRTGRKGQSASMHKLTLGFQSRIHDVLLPDKAADVRFFRSGRLRYRPDHKDTNIREWTDAVIANIESGGRLTAPPLRLEIPKWTIPGFTAAAKGMRTVTYHFSGIQFRQSVSGDLLGESISYSTVQSGKLGAKGGALTAHYNGHGDTVLQDQVAIQAFVERCFKMVGMVTEAGKQTAPVMRLARPRHEGGQRKTRRMGEGYGREDRAASYPAHEHGQRMGEEIQADGASHEGMRHHDEGDQDAVREDSTQRLQHATPDTTENARSAAIVQQTGDQFPG